MQLHRYCGYLLLAGFALSTAACQERVPGESDPAVSRDTVAPSVEITTPTGAADYSTPLAFIGIGGTASDNLSVASVTWVNSRGGEGTASGTTIWTANSIPLLRGENLITVTAEDADGNQATDEIVVTFESEPGSDVTPPEVRITSPTSASAFSSDNENIALGGNASDNNSVSRVTWVNDRGGQGAATGTVSWSISSISLLAGENRITVTAADPDGNTDSDEIVISYEPDPAGDVTPPQVTIVSPTRASSFTSDLAEISLGGTASDNVAVDSVTWVNNRGGQGVAAGTGSWTIASIALQSGDNRITVTANDRADNQSTDVLTVRYTSAGDTTDPLIEITSPSDSGSYTTGDDSIVVAGNASDNSQVTEVRWQLNGGAMSDAIGLRDWSTSVVLLQSGDNLIRVVAEDAAGNEATAEIVVTQQIAQPDVLRGIAVIGDSNADEYRANDNRGGAYSATTLNWVEQLTRYRGLNFGSWESRSSPRRSGYEYNWALSGATASSMIGSGQHSGVAQQVASGEVSLVFIDIGYNDFARERYAEIYSGGLSGQSLNNKINGVISDITRAVDTVQAAGSVSIVVAGLYDYSINLPQFLAAFPNAAGRQAVIDAIRAVNSGLQQMTSDRGAAYVDQSANAASVYAAADGNWFLDVGGELIDMLNPGNEPHHAQLNDTFQHIGTVFGGLFFGNLNFISTVNDAFGTSIVPFSDQELLSAAGISP
jgi:hypothetical protein